MTPQLVLSLFPGIGLLDHAFELEGFCVVRGPDVIWGGDVRTFHPRAGRFDGIIGGDPCQSHSSLANLVRAKGLEPSFPDLGPEYERVVNEARPAWFLRENVPRAPDVKPDGYDVRTFLLDNSTLCSGDGTGNEQMRRRRFWFGVREGECPELRKWIDFALYELPDAEESGPPCGHGATPGQRDRAKVTAVGGHDGRSDSIEGYRKARRRHAAVASDGRFGHRVNDGTGSTVEGNYRAKQKSVTQRADSGRGDVLERWREAPVTGRNEGRVGSAEMDYSPPRLSLEEMLRLQGLPPGWIGHQPWTVSAMRRMIGNGVAVPTGRAIAKAIRTWLETQR